MVAAMVACLAVTTIFASCDKDGGGSGSGKIDKKLIGMWTNFESDYYDFYSNGTFEYHGSWGYVYEGRYSTSNGRIYFSKISYYETTFGGGRTETKTRVDLVSDYAFVMYGSDEYLKIYEIDRSHDTTDIKIESCDEFWKVDNH